VLEQFKLGGIDAAAAENQSKFRKFVPSPMYAAALQEYLS
jgi:hypothetical protein